MAATSQGLVASMPFCCTSMGRKVPQLMMEKWPQEKEVGFETGVPDAAQKGYPPPLPGSIGRSGHNSAAACAQPAPEPSQRPYPGRGPVGRSGCTPKLAFLTAGRLGPRLQGPEAETPQGEKRRQPVKPSQDSSSCCYSLTNMAAADAAAACPGRAPSRSRGSTSWPSRLHSSIFSSKGEGSERDLPWPSPPPPPPPHTPTARAPAAAAAAARAIERLAPARVRLGPECARTPAPTARAPSPTLRGSGRVKSGSRARRPISGAAAASPSPLPLRARSRPGPTGGPTARAGPEAVSPGASRASLESRGLRASWVALRSPHLPRGAALAPGCPQHQHPTRLEPQRRRHLAWLRPPALLGPRPRQPPSYRGAHLGARAGVFEASGPEQARPQVNPLARPHPKPTPPPQTKQSRKQNGGSSSGLPSRAKPVQPQGSLLPQARRPRGRGLARPGRREQPPGERLPGAGSGRVTRLGTARPAVASAGRCGRATPALSPPPAPELGCSLTARPHLEVRPPPSEAESRARALPGRRSLATPKAQGSSLPRAGQGERWGRGPLIPAPPPAPSLGLGLARGLGPRARAGVGRCVRAGWGTRAPGPEGPHLAPQTLQFSAPRQMALSCHQSRAQAACSAARLPEERAPRP
ncbi:atherin-like [Pteronotus mesoamericanus]|uniref:atherin-like n=1 Tax=Pteronotus mesoamericanus TaxID=1884717 RepID=UPI0023EB4C09|nr:atherin-like [Pteronotus parnellii mesoamericanus]